MKTRRQDKRGGGRLARLTAVLFLTGGLILTACSGSETPPESQAPAPGASAGQTLSRGTATTPEEKIEIVYTYDPAGKRDPFAPLIIKEEQKVRTGDLPPLERYHPFEFLVTGIVWGGLGYSAMLEGPDGRGYFIQVGALMGKNKGVVKKITPNSVVIEEKFKTSMGEIDRKEIVLELRRKKEGM